MHALALLFPLLLAVAQEDWPSPDPQAKVGVKAVVSPKSVQAGQTLELSLLVAMEFGWHINAMSAKSETVFPTSIQLTTPWNVSGGWQEPPPHPFRFPGDASDTMVHEGQVSLKLAIPIPNDAAPGTHSIHGKLHYQTCNNQSCLPPSSLPFEVSVEIQGGSSQSGRADPETPVNVVIDPEAEFGVAAEFVPRKAAPGSTVLLRVHVEASPGWHVYDTVEQNVNGQEAFNTKLELASLPAGLTLVEGGGWSHPEPFEFEMPALGRFKVYEGRVAFERAIRIAEDAKPGELILPGDVQAMACNDQTCKIPKKLPFRATVTVDSASEVVTSSTVTSSSTTPLTKDDSWTALLWLAVSFAFWSWVMPCVYPMIPITISFFGKVAEQKHTGRTAVATSYGIGIAGTFVVVGLVIGIVSMFITDATGRADLSTFANTIATNPWLNLAIGALFVAFALSMFGLFEIRAPNWLINRTDRAGRSSKSSHVGAVFLGITFSLASFTCTVPFVGVLLVMAATGTGEALARCTTLMLVYGVVFAAPFVLLSMFPAALAKLPKAGGWMETIKVGFGFLELGAALKFLWVPDREWDIGLMPRPVVLWLLLSVGIASIAFFLGLIPIGHGISVKPFRVGLGRWITIVIIGLALWPVVLSLQAKPTYQSDQLSPKVTVAMEQILPPPPTEDDQARAEGWFVDDYDGALADARSKNRPLFIDFTGIYCGNCRAMERTAFRRKEVLEHFEKMVLVRLYVDRKEQKHQDFARMQVTRYGLSSQPYYVILDPKDESTLAAKGGYIPDEFEPLLREGLEEFQVRRSKASR